MILRSDGEVRYLQAMGVLSGLCAAFVLIRVAVTGTGRYLFIIENLALAWMCLIFCWLLVSNLKKKPWLSWQNILLSALWLLFLPNSWYVLTDFVHVNPTGEISELYDITMISTLVFSGFTLGFTSLYLVHKQLLQRLSAPASNLLVAVVIFLSSFAIYLGRDLRWNSWDVIANPSGIILNITDRIIDPLGHPRALNVTGIFFVLLSGLYLAVWLLMPLNSKRSGR